ncbi:MAG: putative metal-binding protein [Verrucomicrobiaceae bacterium]|nr:putative metal-binding protein [Verrucomicrobiaceae bacterium]
MKFTILSVLFASLALTLSAQAEATIKLTGVHNCCGKCEKGIQAAVTKVEGASVVAEKDVVTITAKDEATAKKAEASLIAGGYAGKESVVPTVADAKVKSATVSGVHLCCGKCVTAVEKAVKSVAGATSHTATKGAESFKVEGDFSKAALSSALQKNGLSGAIN